MFLEDTTCLSLTSSTLDSMDAKDDTITSLTSTLATALTAYPREYYCYKSTNNYIESLSDSQLIELDNKINKVAKIKQLKR